jgi:hypothetical protein
MVPKVFDLGRMTLDLVMGKSIQTWMPVWSSALFGLAALSAGLVLFSRRDY